MSGRVGGFFLPGLIYGGALQPGPTALGRWDSQSKPCGGVLDGLDGLNRLQCVDGLGTTPLSSNATGED